MKYIIITLLIVLSFYPLSFAKYNWRGKNKLGAAGVAFLALFSVLLPTVLILTR